MTRNNVLPILLFAAVALGSEARSLAQSICAPAVPQDVCKLEDKIYTDTDFKNTDDVRGVMVGLKQLLIAHIKDPSSIQDHIVGLVEHVLEQSHEVRAPRDILAGATGQPNLLSIHDRLSKYEQEHGPIVPLDWTLPTDFLFFGLNTTRGYSPVKDRTTLDFGIFCILNSENVVEQVQVIRYPNEVVLDRQAGIGSWKEFHMGKPTPVPAFSFASDDHTSGQKEGLYLLNVKVKNKPMTHGWFVLSRTTPTANPVIRTPSPGEVLHTGNPTFRWVDYQSPEYKPFNQKKRILSVYDRGPGPNERAWTSSVVNPDGADSLKFSDAPNVDGTTDLKNGVYALKAHFEERWFFGGLMIGRTALVAIPFSVAK